MATDVDAQDRQVDDISDIEKHSELPDSAREDSIESPSTQPSQQSAAEGAGPGSTDVDPMGDDESPDENSDAAQVKPPKSHVRLAITVGLIACAAMVALIGWLAFQQYQTNRVKAQREVFVQVGRQGALNLTTIDWEHADSDVQRIMDSATGIFYDDFSKRQQYFIAVVKKAQSKSSGTITEAGLESATGDEAKVLVALSVKTSNSGAAEQQPRSWRMRISVQKTGNEVKVSNVEFVP
ncbi:MAG TPA: Mce protein [Mycobacterium sp.]